MPGNSALGPIVKSFGARAVTLPLAVVASLLTVRLLIETLDVEGYALYALVATLPAFVPVPDLGLGVGVTDAVARRGVLGDETIRRRVDAVVQRLVTLALVLDAVAIALGVSGRWHVLLGLSPSADVELAAVAAVVSFSFSLPVAVSYRALQGGGLNHHVVMLRGGTPVLLLGLVGAGVLLDAPAWSYPAAPGITLTAAGALGLVIARRRGLMALPRVVRWPLWSSSSGLWRMALPMLIITVSIPAAYAPARIILSHQSSLLEVAVYSVAFQVYVPLSQLVSAAGESLWAGFAQARDHGGTARRHFLSITALFGAAGVAMAITLVLVGPLAVRLLTDGRIDVATPLFLLFGALLVVQGVQYPAGMLLTDESGLRVQAVCWVTTAVVAVTLTIWLSGPLGASGPVLAAVATFAVLVLVPTLSRALAVCAPGPGTGRAAPRQEESCRRPT